MLNTKLIIKQNSTELKQEILNALSKENHTVSQKDLQINSLVAELNGYKLGNPNLFKQVEVLFPEVKEFSLGKLNNFIAADSTQIETVVLYRAKDSINESQFKSWLELQLNTTQITVINLHTDPDIP